MALLYIKKAGLFNYSAKVFDFKIQNETKIKLIKHFIIIQNGFKSILFVLIAKSSKRYWRSYSFVRG